MKKLSKLGIAQKNIKKAENALKRAKYKFDRAYVDNVLVSKYYEITDIFLKSRDPIVKGAIVKRLEGIIEKYGPSSQCVFDPEQARRIRENEGLSLIQVSEMIGVSYPTLGKYEQGKISFNYPFGYTNSTLRSPFNIKQRYLEWLKEKGYNPFNIS
jgi:hypothetical protein